MARQRRYRGCSLAPLVASHPCTFCTFEREFVESYILQITAYVKSFPKEDIERIGKDIYERNLKALPATNMAALAITYFMQGLVIGFFVNIILSVILRKQPKP